MMVKSRPNCPISPSGSRLKTSLGEVPARTGAFLISFVACWLKLRKQIASCFYTWPRKWLDQGMVEPQATKPGLPGWMRIGIRIGQKGLKPHRSGAARGDKMNLRCPKCNSTDLKKVSLAHEEGLFRSEGRTRLNAVVAGSGEPDLVVGRATTRCTEQSALSKKLTPPLKWSYLKVIGWSVLLFVGVGWLVFYVNTVTAKATTVSSAPLTAFALISSSMFVLLLFV